MMKSIVEEASSIEKAITQAWARAGKPQKFTITVFQEPEKNFFGMTTAKAKIGFMFDERSTQPKTQKRPTQKPREARTSHSRPKRQEHHEQRPQRGELTQKTTVVHEQKPREQKNDNRFWTQEMIDNASTWLTDTLKIMNKESIQFSVKPNRYHLKVLLSEPLSGDEKKEKTVFRSFAHLIMQAQRSAFKKAFKHHKVILTSS